MAIYGVAGVTLPSGVLHVSIFTNNGDSATYPITGNTTLSVSEITEAVEENGLGGVLRIPSMSFKFLDVDAIFHDEVFDRSTVTIAECYVSLDTTTIFFGSVKLSTVEYETLYDDEGGTALKTVSFEALGLVDKLTGINPVRLREYLDTVDTSGTESTSQVFPHGGFTHPTSLTNDATVGTENWVNPYAGSFPDGFVTGVFLTAATSKYLKALNFLNYPDGTVFIDSDHLSWTVDGIEVLVYRYALSGDVTDNSVKIVKAGVISGTEQAGTAGSSPWAAPPTEKVTYGSPTDLWGLAWSPSDFNSSTFGVAISVTSADVGATPKIDSIRIKVYMSNPSGVATYVKVIDVFDSIATLMAGTTLSEEPTVHEITDTYTGDRTSPTTVGFDDIYLPYTDNAGAYYGLFADPAPTSFLAMSDVKEVLKSLCNAFLVYATADSSDGVNVHLTLRRRNTGDVVDAGDIGVLMSSLETSYIGYDAVRTYQLGATPVNGLLGQVATPLSNPVSITDADFNKIAQRFDFATPVIFALPGFPYLLSGGVFHTINIVTIDSVAYTDYALMLNTKFLEYWTSPVYITRNYGNGTGVGVIEILGQIPIDAIDYSAIEITRDFIANEVTLKLVQFS